MRQLVYIFVLCGLFSWESWCQSLTEQEQLLREGRDWKNAWTINPLTRFISIAWNWIQLL